MPTGLAALEHTDWGRLYHAYGRATDTPEHLRALLGQQEAARRHAIAHLWSAIIHQGTPWTATAPTALVIAGLLRDGAIDRGDPIWADLLAFLAAIAELAQQADSHREELEGTAALDIEMLIDDEDEAAIFEDEEAAEALYARALLGCIQAAPVLMPVLLSGLEHPSPRARANAAMGAVDLARTEALHGQAQELERRLLALARAAPTSDERSAHVLALGSLGHTPLAFLDDASPAVRLCAALAPSLAGHPRATGELLGALERHAAEIDGWFTERPPQLPAHPRFAVVARLVEQVRDFAQLAEAAIAAVEVGTLHSADFDWGPLLRAAFSAGDGQIASEAQRRYLAALVRRAELWNPTFGNASLQFRRAGLPYDREACARLVGAAGELG
ncbi:hypothetical protein F8S13_01740 [Chloroflexia bacterium SDU3-3]|nr:hypothetical protein F8S13_01740 [Chloroflexia bacterium SDU3-3]